MAGILAGAFLGGVAANALITGSMAAGIQAQLHYSREDERQADQLGFRYATAAGFVPSALTEALKKISRGNWMDTSKMPPYLLTHPTGPERMANLDSMASSINPGPQPRKSSVSGSLSQPLRPSSVLPALTLMMRRDFFKKH